MDILKLIELVFISNLSNHNLSLGRIKINKAKVDTVIKLNPQGKQKNTVENRRLSETDAYFQSR